MKQRKITRSVSRTSQISKSGRGTYVKPPRMRHSVVVVKQALRGIAALATLQFAAPAFALPTGGEVVAGSASISQTNAQTMQINQSSQKAILNWQGFSIAKPETVNFVQPNSSSVALNRVVGNSGSEIYGALNANGQVFLVNPNGILFAPGSSVNVGGLAASTLNISDQNFLAGKNTFEKGDKAGSVVNQGTINAPTGYAALIGPKVVNEGFIRARTVALAAGNRVALDMIGDGLISVRVEQAALGAMAWNKGTIHADGGSVLIHARSADALLDTVVNNTGVIRATSLVERNGTIILDGGTAGVVANSGTLDVAGVEAGATGGTVKLLGENVGLFHGTRIDASGHSGGGTVLIGGNLQGSGPEQNASHTYVGSDVKINADAVVQGDGGTVIVWSNDGTRFHGDISARGGAEGGDGGFVEVSGKHGLVFDGNVTTSAPKGRAGTLLLDPDDLFIVDGAAGTGDQDAQLADNNTVAFADINVGGNTVSVGQIQAQGDNNITLQATNTITVGDSVGGSANVDLSATLTTSTNTLTLSAGNGNADGTAGLGNVTFNTGSVITTGGGSVAINAGQTGDTTGNAVLGAITTNGGAITVTAQGSVSLQGAQNAGGGDVVLTTSTGNITGTGLVTGNNVTLDSATGVGTGPGDRVNTAAQVLAARSRVSGGVFVAQANAVALATIGGVTNSAAGGGAYNVTSGGAITVNNGINTGGTGATTLTTTAGGIAIGANDVGNAGSVTTLVSAADITGTTGVVHGTDVTLDSATGVGTGVGPTARVRTEATTLAARASLGGGVFVTELDGVSLNTIGGVANGAALGMYDVNAGGAITVDGNITTNNGAITLRGTGLTNNATISNGGGGSITSITLQADDFDLVGGGAGAVQAGAGAVLLRPHTATKSFGVEDAAADINITNADIATISTTDFVVFGSGMAGVFTGNMTIGVDTAVDGIARNLAFFRQSGAAGTTTIGANGLTTTGNVIISAGGGSIVAAGGPGTIAGNQVQLRASTGIGTPGARVHTSANTLAVDNNGTGGAFVTEQNAVTLADVNLTVGGLANNATNRVIGGGAYDVVADGGTITVGTGGVNTTGTGSTRLETTVIGTNISLGANNVGHAGSDTTLVSAGNITSTTGTVRGSNVSLDAVTGIGLNPTARLNTDADVLAARVTLGGSVFVSEASGVSINTLGGVTNTTLGSYDVTAAGPITVNADIGGNAGVVLSGTSLTNNAVISNNGSAATNSNIVLSADAFNLVGDGTASINAGPSAVLLRPRTATNSFGVEDAAANVNITNADIATINTSDFVVFGSGIAGILTGNMSIGVDTAVLGGTRNLAFFRAGVPGTTTVGANGLTTTGNVIVSAGGGSIISNGGTVAGNQVQLRASTGIGNTVNRVQTSANTLAINNGGGGAFVTEANDVSLANVNLTVGGTANNVGNSGGNGGYNFVANGSITVNGNVTTNVGPNGAINLTGNSITNHALISNGGGLSSSNIVLNADAFSLANLGASINSGAGATILRPRTVTKSFGIEDAAADVHVSNADIATIQTTDFVLFGSGMPGLFTGNMSMGVDNAVNGGTKNLAFLRDAVPGTTTIGPNGVSTTGNVIVSAGGGAIVSQGGTITGNQVELRASTGIGTLLDRVRTAATTLAVQNAGNGGSGAFVSEANAVTLANVNLTIGGTASNAVNTGGGGAYDVIAGGTLSVGTGGVNTAGTGTTRLETTLGNISIGANSVGNLNAATTLISAGDISGTGGTVSGTDVSLAAIGGIGTLVNPIQVDAGTLNFNAAAAVSISEGNDTVLTGINTAGSLSLASVGSLTDAPNTSLTVAGNASFSGNSITLGDNAGDTTNLGSLTFNSAGAVSIAEDSDTVLSGTNTAGSLTLGSAGSITDAPATSVTVTGSANFSGTSILLADNAGDVLSVGDNASFSADVLTVGTAGTANFGTLTFNSPGLVSINEASDTVLSGTSTANGLMLISAGAITDAAGTSLAVTNDATLIGSSISLADNAGDVLSVGGNALLVAGSVSIEAPGAVNFGTLTFVSPGAVSIHEDSDTVLTGANMAGSLALGSAGSITDAPGMSVLVTGNANLSGSSITLGDNPGDTTNFGSLTFNAAGTVSISEDSATVLSGSGTAGSLSLTSAGSITDAPGTSLTVTGNANLSGTSITLGDNAGDAVNFGSLTFNAAGAVSISEASDTVLTGANTAQSLTLSSAGSIADAPNTSLVVTGNASLSGTSITLGDNAGDVINFGSLTFNSAGAVSINEASATEITGTNTAGSLALTSAGAITDAAGTHITVGDDASFSGTSIVLADNAGDVLHVTDKASFSGGSITIAAPGDVNFGRVQFNSPGAVVINEDCCSVITGGNTAGSLEFTSAGGIADDPAGTSIVVTGNAKFTGTSITLGDSAGDTTNFGTLTFNSAGTVSISEDSATALTGDNTAASLVLSSAGAITEVGTSLVVTGNASFSGASINLGNNVGDTVNFGSLTFSSPGAVNISEDSATILSGASNAGSLTLKSLGSVTQQAGATLVVNGAGSIDAGSNPITLTNAGNDFVGLLTLKGTVTNVTDTNGISVQLDTGETVIIANGNLTSTGDLSLGGTTSGNLIGISNGGVVQWTNLTVGSNGSPKAALLIAAQPSTTITGPGSAGNAFAPGVTYSKLANATGGTVNVPGGEFVLIADNLPRHPSSPDLPTIIAKTAVLDIQGLTPGNRVTIKLNGVLRLLADKGVFRFTGESVLPEGVTTLDPANVKVFVGNTSITSTTDELAARAAISAAQQSALSSASADARQSFGTDSVTQQIDMGFSGDVGIAPTMGHSVPLQGEIISTPDGVSESKGGQ